MTAPNVATATEQLATSPPASGAPTSSGGAPPQATNGQFTHKPEEWRYPSDYRVEWMRGKTAEEVANLSNAMYAELVRGQPQQQRGPAGPQQQAAQTQYNSASPGTSAQPPSQEQWITDPAGAAAQYAAYIQQTQVQPMMSNMAQQLGTTARELIRRDYATEFNKWGPEIDLYINQMDPAYRTVDNLRKVVQMVQANHLDEIATDRAKAKLDEMLNSGAVLRPGTAPTAPGAPVPGAVDFKALPDTYKRLLQKYDITPDTLDEFLTKTEVAAHGISLQEARERWFKRASSGDVIVEHKADHTVGSTIGGR